MNDLPLETPRVRLRHFVPEDVAAVHALSDEESSRTWLPSQVYRDEAHARAVLAALIDAYARPGDPTRGPYVLAIEDRADGALIGHVGFSPLDDDVEIGFAVAERRQGRGLATEAITAASRWALATFALERILGVTNAANVASMRALRRAGFVHREDRVMSFQGSAKDVSVFVRPRGSGPGDAAAASPNAPSPE